MIRIDDLYFGYRKTRLYEGFKLALDKPGVHGVFGRNGSGNLTLIPHLDPTAAPEAGTP